ncbi:MAG: antitoxin VapB family protein [Halobacteriales archaeon]
MGTKTVRLDEEVYEILRSRKRDDETFSEAVERIVGGRPLVELAGIYDKTEVEDVEEALEDKYEREDEKRRDELNVG